MRHALLPETELPGSRLTVRGGRAHSSSRLARHRFPQDFRCPACRELNRSGLRFSEYLAGGGIGKWKETPKYLPNTTLTTIDGRSTIGRMPKRLVGFLPRPKTGKFIGRGRLYLNRDQRRPECLSGKLGRVLRKRFV